MTFDKKNIWLAHVIETVNLDVKIDTIQCYGLWRLENGQKAMKKVYDNLEGQTRTMLMKILVIVMEPMDMQILHIFHPNAQINS